MAGEILLGRRGAVTERDEDILRDLYFAPGLTTGQIASMYFDSFRTAKARLYRLRQKGLVVNLVVPGGVGPDGVMWKLGRRAFEREAEAAGRRGERYRTWPKGRLAHLRDTNAVFVAVSYTLDEVLGRFPAWEWFDEPRATERYEFAGLMRQHQPDAEVRFWGLRFFVERETSRARGTAEAFGRKVAGHAAYAEHANLGGKAQTLFACDTERDARHALAAGAGCGFPVFAGGVDDVADHLAQAAREVRRRAQSPV